MDAAEYKHFVLGLIFLKYISDTFVELFQKLTLCDFRFNVHIFHCEFSNNSWIICDVVLSEIISKTLSE